MDDKSRLIFARSANALNNIITLHQKEIEKLLKKKSSTKIHMASEIIKCFESILSEAMWLDYQANSNTEIQTQRMEHELTKGLKVKS